MIISCPLVRGLTSGNLSLNDFDFSVASASVSNVGYATPLSAALLVASGRLSCKSSPSHIKGIKT